MSDYQFRIIQDGMAVASGSCSNLERVRSEAAHYAMVYAEDGPVRCEMKEGKGRWKKFMVVHDPVNGFL